MSLKVLKSLSKGLKNGFIKQQSITQTKQMQFCSSTQIEQGSVASEKLEVVFYHIPKTAGTSFKESLFNAYGVKNCFVATRANGIEKFKHGNAAIIPEKYKVLSGHFQAHSSHAQAYPNAKRLVWLREPMARAFSSMNHWLNDPKSVQYQRIKKCFPNCDNEDKMVLFEQLLKHQETVSLFKTYERFLTNVDTGFFDFVGQLEHIDTDMQRVSNLLGHELQEEKLNLGKIKAAKDFSALECYLPEEIKQYQRFVSN